MDHHRMLPALHNYTTSHTENNKLSEKKKHCTYLGVYNNGKQISGVSLTLTPVTVTLVKVRLTRLTLDITYQICVSSILSAWTGVTLTASDHNPNYYYI